MSNTNDGGPAFPTENERQTGTNSYHFMGMSLRDYFAAKAMQGIVAGFVSRSQQEIAARTVASDAYEIADAMLAARGGGK